MSIGKTLCFKVVALVYCKSRLSDTRRVIAMLADLIDIEELVVAINGDAIGRTEVAADFAVLARTVTVLHHDNSGQEFGGYQAALDAMDTGRLDRLIVLNDTAGSHQFTSRHSLRALCRRLQDPDAVNFVTGQVDFCKRRQILAGLSSCRWVRSNLFGLDRRALESLNYRLYEPQLDVLITPAETVGGFFDRQIDEGLRWEVADWLFVRGHWYGAQPLSAANAGVMAGKARAVLQERYLSMRLEAAGVAFLPAALGRAEKRRHRWARMISNYRKPPRIAQAKAY